ncbi:hypothetical protein [Actinokineospora globicatena]|uniref:Uncharacterized protein n=1 Tax=Actinokineospora globicatena TaxID=103729 RepID=A0A9W6QMU3_9PSEU|nr:hypothetical protein [Actinokineospora globicatena]MCP2305195.1 hypothetical protein [Actinokineospora globicatena]GLW80670.1 hypothetical protein Aglo01_51510 [Actinokineospora globicatena]GLW87497.1 hypothetical protein Aglo02_51360 [Actinokineospora globicatena]GLW93781.1 hypothetical protein Aglo03_45970 [Actinokineospora globicatena]
MPDLTFTDRSDRDDLGAFVARAVRLDQQAVVRLRARDGDLVDAWVATPFDVLATRTARATIDPSDMTVSGNELLASLAVVRGDHLDPGTSRDMLWRSALPPTRHWQMVDHLPAPMVSELADKGLAVARDNVGPQGTPPASLLDQTVLTVSGDGLEVKVPLRCLFALSGMGFLTDDADDQIRVTATDAWMRLDARYGAVVRRRHALLPLLM